MTSFHTVADMLRENSACFSCLDLCVDKDYDKPSFLDLIFSFRHNYTLKEVTLVRLPKHHRQKMQNHRTTEELQMLLEEIFKLPKLEALHLEHFEEEEIVNIDERLSTRRMTTEIYYCIDVGEEPLSKTMQSMSATQVY